MAVRNAPRWATHHFDYDARKAVMMRRTAIALVVVARRSRRRRLVAGQAQSATHAPAAALPDWSGIWAMQGPTVFDRASVQPQNGRAGDAGVREFPPLHREWEASTRRTSS
jgi:hypothetical protein